MFVKSLRGRGVEKSYLDLTLLFQEKGFDVHLILREAIYVLDSSKVKNLHILEGESDRKKALDLRRLLDDLDREKKVALLISSNVSFMVMSGFDLQHCYFTVNMSWGYRLLKRLRFKKYFQVRHEYQGKNIIAVSQGVKHDLLTLLRIRPTSIRVIYDPYDIQKIQLLANQPIKVDEKYIVHIGAFDKIKRHDVLIKAFAKLQDDLFLYLIGEGKEKQKIQKLVKRLGLTKRVRFLGWQDNPYPYVKHAKLTLLSSESEALPRVLIESLIVGTTVVSTDCNFGPREILTGSLKPYLTPVNDVAKLADKIVWALKHPIVTSSVYYQKFAKEEVLQKYLTLLHN